MDLKWFEYELHMVGVWVAQGSNRTSIWVSIHVHMGSIMTSIWLEYVPHLGSNMEGSGFECEYHRVRVWASWVCMFTS